MDVGQDAVSCRPIRHHRRCPDPQDQGGWHCCWLLPCCATLHLTQNMSCCAASFGWLEEPGLLCRDSGEPSQYAVARYVVRMSRCLASMPSLRLACWFMPACPDAMCAADEPTNHLDIETIDALARAINGAQRCQMLPSLLRWLLGEICSDVTVMCLQIGMAAWYVFS